MSTTLGQDGYRYLKDNAKVNEDKDHYSLTQKQVTEYYKGQGITQDTLDTVEKASTELTNGMYRLASDALSTKVQGIKDPEEANKAKVTVSIQSPFGKEELAMTAMKVYPKPGTDEKVTKYAVTDYRIKKDKKFDESLLSDTEASMMKLLDGISK